MPSLNLRVGASVDRSLNVAYKPLIEGAKSARAAIEAEGKKGGRAIATETKKGTKDAEARFRELEEEIRTGMPKATNAGVAAIKGFSKEASASFAGIKRNFADAAREAENAMNRIQRAANKPMPSLGARAFSAAGGWGGVGAGLTRVGRAGMGIGRAGASAAYGLGMSLAHGAGVDTSLESMFKKNNDLEDLAAQVSNSGYIAGDKENGRRVGKRELMEQAFTVGNKTGMDPNDALAGLQKFAGITGDLKLGRELLENMGTLSKATGASMEDMVSAAAEVSMALGDTDHKAEKVNALMKNFAGQGKLGAVEIKDLAKYMAKVTASAGQIEGDTSENIKILGGLAQGARQHGGAPNAAEATTSVAAFLNTLKTPARARAFEAATGKSTINAQGMLRNPEEIIMEALKAKGMDPHAFKAIFANVKGAQAVETYATMYRKAGGGAAGEEAVRKEFDRLRDAAMGDAEIMESFNAAMKTGNSQAELFNISMRKTALGLQDVLMPAAIAAAPALLAMASSASKWIQFFVGKEALLNAEGSASDANVDHAVAATKKQLANHEITAEQQEINKQTELA